MIITAGSAWASHAAGKACRGTQARRASVAPSGQAPVACDAPRQDDQNRRQQEHRVGRHGSGKQIAGVHKPTEAGREAGEQLGAIVQRRNVAHQKQRCGVVFALVVSLARDELSGIEDRCSRAGRRGTPHSAGDYDSAAPLRPAQRTTRMASGSVPMMWSGCSKLI
jgi:hypothetical protein